MTRLNSLFVGSHELVQKTLQNLKPEWNFILPSDTVHNVPETILKSQKESIPEEIHVLFIQDHLFDNTEEAFFEDFISTTPHSLIMVVNYHPHLRQKMIDAVQEATAPLTHHPPPLYFISTNDPLRDIDDGVLRFLMTSDGEENKRVIDLLIKDLKMKTKNMTNKNLHSSFLSL